MGKQSSIVTISFFISNNISLHSFLLLVLSKVATSSITPSKTDCNPSFQKEDVTKNGYLNLYNDALHQKLFVSLHLNSLKNPPNRASQLEQLREICLFQTENSLFKQEVALGYDCLAQLYLNGSFHSEMEFYRALRSASLSLETIYTKNAAINLKKLIISGYENDARILKSNVTDITRCCTGYREDEEPFLESILKFNISTLNARVMFRESLINTFGRSSSKEGSKKINLKLAFEKLDYVRQVSQIKQNKIVDIVLTFNEKYVVHAATTIVSALINSDLDSFYRFHVVMDPDDQLSESAREKLASFNYIRHYSIDFINFPNEIISEEIKKRMRFSQRYPLMVIYRLFLDKVFPKLDLVLSLDTDVIVLRDLNALKLKSTNMENYIWGATLDGMHHPTHFECNDRLPHFYINAGVLIVNLKNMRDMDSHRMMLDNLPSFEKCCFFYNDQDVINTVFADYIYYLPDRWNSRFSFENPRTNFPTFIIHYPGTPKPWDREFEILFKNDTSKVPSHMQPYWQYREVSEW